MDVLTENERKDAPESVVFTDDIAASVEKSRQMSPSTRG